jgi:hypothetical protein
MESYALTPEQLIPVAGPVPDIFQRPTAVEFKFTEGPGLRMLYGDPVYILNGDATMI